MTLLCGGGAFLFPGMIFGFLGAIGIFICWIVLTTKAANYFFNRHVFELSTGKKAFCLGMATLNCGLLFFMVS